MASTSENTFLQNFTDAGKKVIEHYLQQQEQKNEIGENDVDTTPTESVPSSNNLNELFGSIVQKLIEKETPAVKPEDVKIEFDLDEYEDQPITSPNLEPLFKQIIEAMIKDINSDTSDVETTGVSEKSGVQQAVSTEPIIEETLKPVVQGVVGDINRIEDIKTFSTGFVGDILKKPIIEETLKPVVQGVVGDINRIKDESSVSDETASVISTEKNVEDLLKNIVDTFVGKLNVEELDQGNKKEDEFDDGDQSDADVGFQEQIKTEVNDNIDKVLEGVVNQFIKNLEEPIKTEDIDLDIQGDSVKDALENAVKQFTNKTGIPVITSVDSSMDSQQSSVSPIKSDEATPPETNAFIRSTATNTQPNNQTIKPVEVIKSTPIKGDQKPLSTSIKDGVRNASESLSTGMKTAVDGLKNFLSSPNKTTEITINGVVYPLAGSDKDDLALNIESSNDNLGINNIEAALIRLKQASNGQTPDNKPNTGITITANGNTVALPITIKYNGNTVAASMSP